MTSSRDQADRSPERRDATASDPDSVRTDRPEATGSDRLDAHETDRIEAAESERASGSTESTGRAGGGPWVAVLAVIGLLVLVVAGWQVSRPGADQLELRAFGTVRTTELSDLEATFTLESGSARCAPTGRRADPVVVVNVTWELVDDPPDDVAVRVDLDGPPGWSVAGCLPDAVVRTADGRLELPAVVEGKVVVALTPTKPGSVPDLAPWRAEVVLLDHGRPVGRPVEVRLDGH